MTIEIKIPSPGESITEVELASWFVENGEFVEKDQEVGEIESEKATLPLIAEKAGKIELLANTGDTLNVGDIACKIDTSVEKPAGNEQAEKGKKKDDSEKQEHLEDDQRKEQVKADQDVAEGNEQSSPKIAKGAEDASLATAAGTSSVKITPVAKKIMDEEGFSIDDIIQGLRKITASDVMAVKEMGTGSTGQGFKKVSATREEQRNRMSQLRKKISERLVAVKNETAMLTTFNEADMSAVISLRKSYQDKFVEKHGLKLGFMSFFTKAVTLALQQFPNVNSYLDGDEIVTPDYCDVGIAVQTDKGLMVPIIRNTETLGLAEIEQQIPILPAGRERTGSPWMNYQGVPSPSPTEEFSDRCFQHPY